MALKRLFKSFKSEGYVIKPLDMFLLGKQSEDNDRAFNVNAPSQIGKCLRARYFSRTMPSTGGGYDARTQRIFDNGTGTHERLQKYLLDQGMLLMDEVPVQNQEYNIQGHTDGLLKLTSRELGVLEIKSMNSNSFSGLKKPKDEHVKQGLSYIYCLEEQRKFLKDAYDDKEEFTLSADSRRKTYAKLYQHLKGGNKFTREEKIGFQVGLNIKADEILFSCNKPITKAIFLYENKDNQELKEFCIDTAEKESEAVLAQVLSECEDVNDAVDNEDVPSRGSRTKSCYDCKWCNYSNECWVV